MQIQETCTKNFSTRCIQTSVRRRRIKTSTCRQSRTPCVDVEKITLRRREDGGGGIAKNI